MSIVRNVLDPLSNVIGTLTFPDGTSEDAITAALSIYSSAVIDPIVEGVKTLAISSTSTTTTSSSTYTTISEMTLIPPKGTYIVSYSGSVNTGGSNASGSFAVHVNGTIVSDTRRDISCTLSLLGGLVTISTNAIALGTYSGSRIQMNGTDTLDVRFKSTNGGTISFLERTLTLMKVS